MTKREHFVCKNCGEKIHFFKKHGSLTNVWLHAKTSRTQCPLEAEPE